MFSRFLCLSLKQYYSQLIQYRYGIEQEYTLLQSNVKWPLGWPVGGYPGPQVVALFLKNVKLIQYNMYSIT